MTFHRELLSLKQVTKSRTRSLAKSISNDSVRSSEPVDDGEERFMLTMKALPPYLRVIAQLLHPHPQTAQEEHRLACKLLSENAAELQCKRDDIAIPTFKRLSTLRSAKEAEKSVEKVKAFKTFF